MFIVTSFVLSTFLSTRTFARFHRPFKKGNGSLPGTSNLDITILIFLQTTKKYLVLLGPLMAYVGISLSWFYPSVSVARVFVSPNCWARWFNDGDLWVITLLFILTTDFVVSQRGRPPSQQVLFCERTLALPVPC